MCFKKIFLPFDYCSRYMHVYSNVSALHKKNQAKYPYHRFPPVPLVSGYGGLSLDIFDQLRYQIYEISFAHLQSLSRHFQSYSAVVAKQGQRFFKSTLANFVNVEHLPVSKKSKFDMILISYSPFNRHVTTVEHCIFGILAIKGLIAKIPK